MSEPSEPAGITPRFGWQEKADVARLGPLLAIVMMLILLLLPFIGLTEFWQLEIVLMICYALVVSGVNLGFGFAGELALGQVGVFAAGAYLSAWLMMNGSTMLCCACWRRPPPGRSSAWSPAFPGCASAAGHWR